MIVSTMSVDVALKISSTCLLFSEIRRFAKEAGCCQYMTFTHYNFFYSYPEWGRPWKSGKDSEFHKVETKCLICDWVPERNYAGVGHIYMLNNGLCDDEILTMVGLDKKGRPIKEYVKNTPRLSRMILLCPEHIKGYFEWPDQIVGKPEKPKQLSLFELLPL